MKRSKCSKVIFAGLIALSSIAPGIPWNVQAQETDVNQEEIAKIPQELDQGKTIQEETEEVASKNTVTLDENEVVYPTKIALNATLLNLGVNETAALNVVAVTGAQNWDKTTGISWSSSDPSIVSVDANGNLITHQKGEAEITATVTGSPTIQAVCTIIVSDQKPEEIYPTGLSISSTLTLDEGETEKISVGYKGSDITNKEVVWTSSDENVVKVENGTLTAVGAGTAKITVTSVGKNEGQSEPASATCVVIVNGLYQGLKYKIENDQVMIIGYTGTKTDLQIPSTIQGKTVTSIQDNAFMSKKLTSVVIPSSVTSIGKNAFRANRSLRQVSISGNISVISQGAFAYCTSLSSITLPEGVKEIANDAFNNCTSLSTVDLPQSLYKIGSNAFADCDALTTLTLPDNITSLTSTSFERSIQLKVNKGSTTIEAIGTKYNYQEIDPEVYPISIGLNEDEKELVQGDTFQLRLNSYSGDATNTDLIWTTDNDAVATVDENGLVTAVNEGTAIITATSVGKNEGQDAPAFATCTIHVEGVEGDYVYTVNQGNVTITDYRGDDKDLVIPSTIAQKPVTEIGSYSFWSNDEMTSVVIPEGVVKIGDYAFNGNDNLSKITLPGTLKTIGARAFYGTAMEEITIPDGVTSIGREAFNTCRNLVRVKLPQSLTSLGPNAFNSCNQLTEITLPNNITYVGTNALKGIDTIYVQAGSKTQQTLDKAKISYTAFTKPSLITNTVPVLHVQDVTMQVGDCFDPMNGVSATDAEDGNLTDKVVVSGSIEPGKAGKYQLTYSVTDSQGASASKTITVTVQDKQNNQESDQKEESSLAQKPASHKNTDKAKGTNTATSFGAKLASVAGVVSVLSAGILVVLKRRQS